jgi:hypothetical protein
MLALALCTGAMAAGSALAQAPEPSVAGPQVVPLAAECVYQGWRATDVIGAQVVSSSEDELGTARNILVGTTGKVEALIVESASSSGHAEFVFRVPWQKVEINEIPDRVIADLETGSQQRHGLFPGKDKTPPNEFAVTQVIGDYARLQAGLAYGYVNDVVFSDDGRMVGILVTRDSAAGGGTHAFGFPDSIGPWNPAAGYYGLPYVTTEQADAAAVRIDPERFADTNKANQDTQRCGNVR